MAGVNNESTQSTSSLDQDERAPPPHFGPNAPKRGRRFITSIGGGWDRRTEAIDIPSLREPRSRPGTASRSRSQSRPQTANRSRPSTAQARSSGAGTDDDGRVEYMGADSRGTGSRPRSRHTSVDTANSNRIDHSYTKRYGPPVSSELHSETRNAKLKTIYGGQPTRLVYMKNKGNQGGKRFTYVSIKPAGTEEQSALSTIQPPTQFQNFDQWLEGIRLGLVEQLGPAIRKNPNFLKSRPSTAKTTKERAAWQNNIAGMQNELLLRALAAEEAEQDAEEEEDGGSEATKGPQL